MLKECLEIFEKELESKGDKLIIDSYVPVDGTYIIVSHNDNKFKVKDVVNIKYNKKLGEIEERSNINFKDICKYDYYSKLIDMDKPIDKKKKIKSNNYLSFFINKEDLNEGKLTKEIIDGYYDRLSNPYIKYLKGKSKEIYESIEKKLEGINQELLTKIRTWICDNIFSLQDLGIDIKGKGRIKIFFEATLETYQNESKRYLIPNIYNKNDFNENINDIVYGVPNDNMNLNPKKPYLENKSRKIKVPLLVDEEQILLQKKFFDYLMNFASNGKVNIYINEDGIKALENGKLPDADFQGIFMRIKKGTEVEIQSYDLITSYRYGLKKEFKFENVLKLSIKAMEDENYLNCRNKNDMQVIINHTLFSKVLVNNYFTDSKDISIKDSILKRNLLISRDTIFNWIYKGNENGVYPLLNKVSLDLIKNSIEKGFRLKASHQFNLKCSLENYFRGGQDMGDTIHELKNSLREKINMGGTDYFTSDKEYYFAVGQFVNYLLSKSKGKNKPHSLANPFINAKSDKVIKEKLRNLYKRYNYDIYMHSKRTKNIYAMIVSYESEGKVDQDMIMAGYLHSNLIYESNKKEAQNG